MVVCKFSLICLIAVICIIIVRCNTTENNPCGVHIPCDNSRCIPREMWCDGLTDCFDESDEKYCKKKTWLTYPDNNCSDEIHFTCNNRMCIPIVLKCDGIDDCKDNSDEKKCGDPPKTGGTVDPDSVHTRSTESTYSLQPYAPTHLSSTGPLNTMRPVEPTVDHYGKTLSGENVQGPPRNSPTATASASLPVHAPDPTPDSRIPPGNRDVGPFGNLGRHPWPDYSSPTIPQPPTQEPCDKTISGADDDPATHYSVPWSRFTFQSRHSDAIRNQYQYDARRAQDWLMAQRDAKSIWGENTPRALVALALSSETTANLAADDIMQRRLRIDLGAKLIRWRENRGILSTSGLALYINALVATCQNPRNLFERDLVEMLYHEVQGERARRVKDASPFPYLTLCLVDRALTEDDRRFLVDIAGRNVTDEISKDRFILATSALACSRKTLPYDRELERSVEDAFHKLQQQQLDDGSFGSVYSTALAAQALIAIDSQSWNHQSTLNHLLSKQLDDGSFGDFLATYYALPVLNGKCLLHLRNIHCQATNRTDPCEKIHCAFGAECVVNEKTQEAYCHCGGSCSDVFAPVCGSDGVTYPNDCHLKMAACVQQTHIYVVHHRQCGETITKTIHYTLVSAIRNPPETLDTIELVVPQNDNFFDIMKKAQEKKQRFRFLSVEHDNKIDVYQIDGTPNDPEFGKFWILYEMVGPRGRSDSLRRYTQDIRHLIPKDSDELLFYYEQLKPGQQ